MKKEKMTEDQLLLIIIFIVTFLLSSQLSYAQPDLKTIIPPSPTLASLGKYGDIPISNYTGSAGVSVPIHSISTGDFTLNISLNYHGVGVKVEEIASWTGLGWNLTGASAGITRQLRGLPDENGYMLPTGTKVADVMNLNGHDRDEYLKTAVNTSPVDLEPDIFNYNIGDISGKFYYSQEQNDFITLPRDAIYIDKEYFTTTGKWRLIAKNGTEYIFEQAEWTISATQCNGQGGPASSSPATGWFLSKIITPVRKREINFYYQSANYSIDNIASHTKYSSPTFSLPPCVDPIGKKCDSQTEYFTFRLASISYDNGKIEFESVMERLDVPGDRRLDKIKVYLGNETTPSKVIDLNYGYFNENLITQNLPGWELEKHLRLKLTSVIIRDKQNTITMPYTFEYNEVVNNKSLPSRMSYAQDNWGFYNGADSNTDLIPQLRQGPILMPGANRTTNHLYASLGLLSKITYPTKGYTTFEYGAHRVPGFVPHSENNLWLHKFFYLDPSDICEERNHSFIFCDSVNIADKSTNPVLVNIAIEGIKNCSFCPEATTCALLSLESDNFSFPINCGGTSVQIPGGKYAVVADFSNNSDPSVFEDFVIRIDWYEPDRNYVGPGESYVGGARLSKITSYNGLGQTTTKKIEYAFGALAFADPVYEYSLPCDDDGLVTMRTSTSNYPMTTTKGSHIGYGEVTVYSDDNGTNGKTVYKYWSPRDVGDVYFYSYNHLGGAPSFGWGGSTEYPFAPPASLDHKRGLLRSEFIYEGSGASERLVRSIEYFYDPMDGDPHLPETGRLHNATKAIKAMPAALTSQAAQMYAVFSLYEVQSDWIRQVKVVEKNYATNGEVLTSETKNSYGSTTHLQLTSTSQTNSDYSIATTYFTYPDDITINSDSPSGDAKAIKQLRENHYKDTPIQILKTTKVPSHQEFVTSGLLSTFHENSLLPKQILVLDESQKELSSFVMPSVNNSGNLVFDSLFKPRILFSKYDEMANLIEQSKFGDIKYAYKWGYNGEFPIAEAINCSPEDFFYTSFEDAISNVSSQAKTGLKGSTGTLAISLPKPGSYTLTYWRKGSSTSWELVEQVVSSNITIGGSGWIIDEVRLVPQTARMSTFTYSPGKGLTSKTDHNNITTYYDYDDFGRLREIRDADNNLLKIMSYHLTSD